MFNGKVAMVTGAASGIGRSTAVELAKKGASVVISDVDKERLAETEKLISDEGGEVMSLPADVSSAGEVSGMVEETMKKYSRLDVAVNNAGIGGDLAPTADYTEEGWDRVLNINLKGQWLCMKNQIPVMLKNDGGSIVNITSILGKVGFANAPAYVAAKHGLIGLTRTAALEYSAKGVRVNAVAPAFIVTPMLEDAGLLSDPEAKQGLVDLHPIGRLGEPKEVADAIIWLASDEASFVTGHTLMVDGGYTSR